MKRVHLLWNSEDAVGVGTEIEKVFSSNGYNKIGGGYMQLPEANRWMQRIDAELPDGSSVSEMSLDQIVRSMEVAKAIAGVPDAEYHIYDGNQKKKAALLLTKDLHAANGIVDMVQSGMANVEIPVVVSNREESKCIADRLGVPFHFVPNDEPIYMESRILPLIEDTDFAIMAKYMRILSAQFLNAYGKDVINIHHGPLPAFEGANPYQQAFDYGAKFIGATAHFAIPDVDKGPIITQSVTGAPNSNDWKEWRLTGQEEETKALKQAVKLYCNNQLIRYQPPRIERKPHLGDRVPREQVYILP